MSKYFLSITISSIFLATLVCGQSMAMTTKPKTKVNNITNSSDVSIEKTTKENAAQTTQITKFCPKVEELTKKDDLWTTLDNKWKNFTPSSATKVLSFLGAQWVGIKFGKIICLYKTNEAVAFPLAVEQLSSQPILEPNQFGWSSLVNNRKFCKSANIADCPYSIEQQKDISNIYKEIEYNPSNVSS